ncbi:hypothetical protein NL676_013228 [Syzygium grande]|nr:hypothetical protein NL676_013228 [Syzygium grande]
MGIVVTKKNKNRNPTRPSSAWALGCAVNRVSDGSGRVNFVNPLPLLRFGLRSGKTQGRARKGAKGASLNAFPRDPPR